MTPNSRRTLCEEIYEAQSLGQPISPADLDHLRQITASINRNSDDIVDQECLAVAFEVHDQIEDAILHREKQIDLIDEQFESSGPTESINEPYLAFAAAMLSMHLRHVGRSDEADELEQRPVDRWINGVRFFEASGLVQYLDEEAPSGNKIALLKALVKEFESANIHESGQTLLYLTARDDDAEGVAYLIECNAAINGHAVGMPSALDGAVQGGSQRTARLLIDAGCSIDDHDFEDGDTALHLAAATEQPELFRLLIEHGANAEIKNKNDKTPLDVASGDVASNLNRIVKECSRSNEQP